MPVFDFFSEQGLVRPDVNAADAESIAKSLFGITGTAHELGSQQDRNFRIDTVVNGEPRRYVLKVDNPAFSASEIAPQNGALEHLAERGMRVPRPLRGLDGRIGQRWDAQDGPVTVRLLTYVEGPSLQSQRYLAPSVIGALGRLSGTVAGHLQDFIVDGLDRTLQWDLRNAEAVIDRLVHWVPEEEKRNRLTALAGSAAARLATVRSRLRVQTIHGDITDDNVICSVGLDGHRMPEAVIDFGDLGTGWLAAELAVTVASVLHHLPDDPYAVLEAIVAFDEVTPLTDEEIVALWPLIVLRGAVLVVSGEQQVRIDETNDYAKHGIDTEWRVFAAASQVGWDEAEAAIRHALDRPERLVAETAGIRPMIPALTTGDYEVIDYSVTSPALVDGRWLEPDAEWRLGHDALSRRSAAIAPYGQFRLTRTPVRSRLEPATLALFTEVFLKVGEEIVAPVDGVIAHVGDDVLILAAAGFDVHVGGLVSDLSPGSAVTAGDRLGTAGRDGASRSSDAVGRLSVQKVGRPGLVAPKFVRASRAGAWKQLAPDPALLLGLKPHPIPDDAADELTRRRTIMAAAQERYYLRPPQIERGWQEVLVDTRARAYLDMVNNVTAIGHSHPRLTRAVGAQLQLLNTNSRFLYSALAGLCERLVELSPDRTLDTVLLVNSGSEAVDLALRLARIHTGREGVVALREGYHGWSMASDAVSTSAFDNPHAVTSRPEWVHIADAPNSYRGRHRGADSAQNYVADVVRLLDGPDGPGADLAAFISEPVLGNAGGVVPPEGYLIGVYEQIRARGGLCIADEVQVGYGRLGSDFWGVQQQHVVPDIITMAKAMGNGYPLGAVLTRRDIAESLSGEGNFFSSAGGSPVSCVAGLSVLDVIRDESLQQNARVVGGHLASRLAELAQRHPIIGAVHGMGLYLGIELVRDQESREPATAETEAICERLLELGVITQPTSERQNVLKIKPPMCLSRESADFFVDVLDEVLTYGW